MWRLLGHTKEEAFLQCYPHVWHCPSTRPLHHLGDYMTHHPDSPAHICQHFRERLPHQLEPRSEEGRHMVRIQRDWGQNHRVPVIIYHTSTTKPVQMDREFCPSLVILESSYSHFHFRSKKTETRRNPVPCPVTHNLGKGEPELVSWAPGEPRKPFEWRWYVKTGFSNIHLLVNPVIYEIQSNLQKGKMGWPCRRLGSRENSQKN